VKILGTGSLGNTYLVTDIRVPGHPERVIRHLQLPLETPRVFSIFLEQLKRRAQSLNRLNQNPQTPEFFGHFEQENNFYLVEEYIPGSSLETFLTPGKPLLEPEVIRLLQEMLQILVSIHGQGLIHRCIKPKSLIRHQTDGHLVLVGLDVFKEISTQVARSSGKPMPCIQNGTAAYVSPEQTYQKIHFSTDIYSVGIIGIQAISGHPASKLVTLINPSQNGSALTNWQQGTTVSPELAAILNRMVHPDLEQRYKQASDVLDDLRKLRASAIMTSQSSSPKAPQSKLFPPKTPDPEPTLPRSRSPLFKGSARVIGLGLTAMVLVGGLTLLLQRRVPQQIMTQRSLERAETLANQGQYDQAIALYDQSIERHPTAIAYYGRGLAQWETDNLGTALEDLSQAIQLDPNQPEFYYQRANLRFELGDRQSALADYTNTLRLNPDLINAYINRGTVRAELGDEVGAIADYTEAIQRNPNLMEAYLNRCLSNSNLENHTLALDDCTMAIQLQPSSVMAYQNRGLVRRRLGDQAGAIEDFNIAIRLDPDDPDPYYNRGLARLEMGDVVGAIADFTTTIERDPEHFLAYYDRGVTRSDQGDLPGALADLQQSARLCLDQGLRGCYEDAQYELQKILQDYNAQASN
jgi:serine/threonine-protein kinase